MSSGAETLERQRQLVEPGDVIVVCGLPGVGKSTVSRAIAEVVDGEVFRTDVVRKDVVDDPQYTPAEKRRVYEELFDRAREHAESGRDVVLDGTYKRRTFRDRANELAEDLGSSFELVTVECDEAVVERRIREREDDASEADFDVYLQYKDEFEPIRRTHRSIDNSGDLEQTHRQVRRQF